MQRNERARSRSGVTEDERVARTLEPEAAEGFDAVYVRERQAMLRVAYLIVGSVESAEDVVHDAFVALHRHWDDVDNPGGYLRRTVINRSLSWQRDRRVEERHLLRHEGVATSSPGPTEPLWELLLRLPPAQRTALVLVNYLDLSSEMAAQQMGCRPSTVRSLVRRGISTLRKELQ